MTGEAKPIPDEAGLAADLLAAYDAKRQLAPLCSRFDDFPTSCAYRIAHHVTAMRRARGETTVGRKIGFTNRTIWSLYGVTGPMWGHVYRHTLHDLPALPATVPLPILTEPRIEPEIIFGLKHAPIAGMSQAQIADCIDWVAHGFEIVFSPFPGWKFTGADCAAGFGLHGALFVGPRVAMASMDPKVLSDFSVTLRGSNGTELHGHSTDVLDGPLAALGFLLDTLAQDPQAEPLRAGEVVTTGTLTDAAPLSAGGRWVTTLEGIDLPGLDVRFGPSAPVG
ncbi:MAG: hypothetical protein LJE68_06230 [Rhodobacter sp.]|nr:hypothetical protein [Rhodobacter sp.]